MLGVGLLLVAGCLVHVAPGLSVFLLFLAICILCDA